MQITIETDHLSTFDEPRVGNVYPVRGARGLRDGKMMILLAITESNPRNCCSSATALMLVITKEGKPSGVTQYGLHYIQELSPIAFVDGLDDLSLIMRSL